MKEKLKLAKTAPDTSAASATAAPSGATGDATTTAERAKDVLRAAVRCFLAMQAMNTVQRCPLFVEFFQRVLKTAMLARIIEELKAQG